MRLYILTLLTGAVMLLSACGGGHDDSYEYYHEETYIYWADSVNGTIVVDATDDGFEFEIHTGYLHFGNTTYSNAWIDSYGDFYIDGIHIGAVYYVESVDHEIITALVSNDGFYIDIHGPESHLSWSEAPSVPIYALNRRAMSEKQGENFIYTQAAQQALGKPSVQATPPDKNLNAYTENLPVTNESTISKLQ